MLGELKEFYKEASPVIIPKWNDYLGELDYQRNELKRRFVNVPWKQTSANMLIKQIVEKIDIPLINSYGNDFDRLRYYFKVHNNVYRNIYDPVRTGRGYFNLFYNSNSTVEYICPVDDIDHIKLLPLGKDFKDWVNIKPITLWYHDTLEYSLDITNNKINIPTNKPNFSVIMLDTVALTFKYYKYMIDISTPNKSFNDFIINHVLVHLFQDLQDVWILNLINLVIDKFYINNTLPLEKLLSSNRNYGYKGARIYEALYRLEIKIKEIQHGLIRPTNLLSSKLFPNNLSIRDKINYSYSILDIPPLTQYRYMELIRDLPYLRILINLYSLKLDYPNLKNMLISLRIKLSRLNNLNIHSAIKNNETKKHVEMYLKDLTYKVENTISKI